MEYNENKLQVLCANIVNIAEPQFDFAYKTFANLIPAVKLSKVKRIVVTGCGDSYVAAAEAKSAFDKYLLGTDCVMTSARIIEASRFLHFEEQEPDTLLVAVSASGSPARISEVLKRGKKHGCMTVALTNKAESNAAKNADYVYLTSTTPDSPGLGSFYASMLSLFVMAAVIGDLKKGKTGEAENLKQKLLQYNAAFFEDFAAIDATCRKTAEVWQDSMGFEVVADGPLLSCGEFVSAKYAEAAGEKCTFIDSENYLHVNSLLCPSHAYGTLVMAVSDEANITRISDTANSIVGKQKRQVLLVCDKEAAEVGIHEPLTVCKVKVPEKDYRFLFLLYAFIPGAILAGYHAQIKQEPYFRRSENTFLSNPASFTIVTSEITVI